MIHEYKGKKLYYNMIGEGTPVLMIHGRGCDYRLMSGAFEPIFQVKNYKRIYFDLPGMGQSEFPDGEYSSDSILEFINSFVAEVVLKESESFLLVGQSYGGYLARGVLEKYHEKIDGMFLLCPVIYPMRDDRNVPKDTVRYVDEEFVKKLSEEDKKDFLPMAIIAHENVFNRFENDIKPGLEILDRTRIRELITNYKFTFDVDQKLRDICFAKPVSFVNGRYDVSVGYKDSLEILEDYPNSSFVILDRAGHYLQMEQVEHFNYLVREWLERTTNFCYDSPKKYPIL